MCITDYRIGQLIRPIIYNFSPPTDGQTILAHNNNRIAFNIAICGPAISGATVIDILTGTNRLFHLYSGLSYVHCDIRDYGRLVKSPLTIAVTSGSTAVLSVIEWELPEGVLEAEIREFYSSYYLQRPR